MNWFNGREAGTSRKGNSLPDRGKLQSANSYAKASWSRLLKRKDEIHTISTRDDIGNAPPWGGDDNHVPAWSYRDFADQLVLADEVFKDGAVSTGFPSNQSASGLDLARGSDFRSTNQNF